MCLLLIHPKFPASIFVKEKVAKGRVVGAERASRAFRNIKDRMKVVECQVDIFS
jgi:hypothetical protein